MAPNVTNEMSLGMRLETIDFTTYGLTFRHVESSDGTEPIIVSFQSQSTGPAAATACEDTVAIVFVDPTTTMSALGDVLVAKEGVKRAALRTSTLTLTEGGLPWLAEAISSAIRDGPAKESVEVPDVAAFVAGHRAAKTLPRINVVLKL